MTYNEALEYIHSVEWLGSRPGLSRTQKLLAKLGNPEKDMKFIHVAGTNGKGSTCAMLSAMLISAGYKTGLYTSPYIVRFNERMQINGEPISDSELASLVEIIKPIAESMEDKPTEFEIITALAFLYYKRNGCDVVVLEVGMGGRLDSTNVIEAPLVSVITGIALDHTGVLGDSVACIAAEKAGIIKKGCPVVYGGRDDAAYKIIRARCEETGSELVRTNLKSLSTYVETLECTRFSYSSQKGIYIDVSLPLLGKYQMDNAATVIETGETLIKLGFTLSRFDIRRGIRNACWNARFELLAQDPPVIFDGSHNIQGVTAAAESIKQYFGDKKVALLMGVLADKDYSDMVNILAPLTERVFTITPPSPRALGSDDLAAIFNEAGTSATAFGSIQAGVESAYNYVKTHNMPLVMLGSLYMYCEVLRNFEKIKN